MKVFVTGLSGFLGASVAKELQHSGHDAFALCRSEAASRLAESRGATPIAGDLDSLASVTSAIRAADPDAVLHIASMGFGHAATMVGAPTELGVKRAVFVSTTAIFTKLNAGTKAVRLTAEREVTDSSLDWTIVRPTMIYGRPGDRNLERLVRRVKQLPILPIPGAESLQQPVHVDDLARSIVNTLARPESIGRAINTPGPKALSFQDIVRETAAHCNRKIKLVPVPVSPVVQALKLLERTPVPLPLSSEQVERLDEDKAFDGTDAVELLGHNARSFTDGIGLLVSLLNDSEPKG